MKPEPVGDAYRYDGRILCEPCGESERCEIVESSGKPRTIWEGYTDSTIWPQPVAVPIGTPCAECGREA